MSWIIDLYGACEQEACFPDTRSLSFHCVTETDGNLLIAAQSQPVEGLHRDADTIQYLRLMENLGDPINPDPNFRREQDAAGMHLFNGQRATADGKFFEFANQPLGAYEVFSQPQWGSERGWLFPWLYRDSFTLNYRWPAWGDAGLEGQFDDTGTESAAITAIEPLDIVYETPERIRKLFHHCFDLISPGWRVDDGIRKDGMTYLFAWMLYGFGHQSQTRKPSPGQLINPNSFDILAQILPPSIKLFMLWPRAHFSYLLEELSDMSASLISSRMPSETILLTLDEYLSDTVHSPLDIVFCHETNGPLLVTASNHSNMLIPMTKCVLTAVAGIIDLYLQAPFTAIPCEWEFQSAVKNGGNQVFLSPRHELDYSELFDLNFNYFPFILLPNG
jgi:hypothetical protein